MAKLSPLLCACLFSCAGTSAFDATEDDARTPAPSALTAADFKAPLDRALIRKSNFFVDDATFDARWTAAHTDALSFFRAFAPAYHLDLAQVKAAHVPGGEDLCLGDAHPENFGFQDLGSGDTIFAPNDFDDSGYCPVAFDALRFFTALRLQTGDVALVSDAVDQYVAVLQDAKAETTVDGALFPDFAKVHKKQLGKETSGDKFDLALDPELGAATAAQKADVAALLKSDARFKPWTLLDVAVRSKPDGGSADLARLWLLVDHGPTGERTIVELKPEVPAGVEQGRHSKVLRTKTRLATLEQAFWGDTLADDQFDVPFEGGRWLVRDRLSRKSISLADLTAAQVRSMVFAEASQLALLHAKGLSAVKRPGTGDWLLLSSATLATRWTNSFASGK
ncbi:MAG: DUF2252 family protein [Deltaproteobacteria bacterium]|nr:DUF2252 family protein [Deltaproteobacteria bacterium]